MYPGEVLGSLPLIDKMSELADRLFRQALVDPIAASEVGFNRRTKLGRIDLALECFFVLATVDPIAHVVAHAALRRPFVDARHTRTF